MFLPFEYHLPPAPISGHKFVSALLILQVKETDLLTLLAPVGFVWEVTIPKKDDGKSDLCGAACLGILPVSVVGHKSFKWRICSRDKQGICFCILHLQSAL